MAHYSKTFCQSQVDKYVAAEEKILAGQSYSIGGRSLSRPDLSEVRKAIDYWSDKLADASVTETTGNKGPFMRRSVPHG